MDQDRQSLRGKTVFITGASRGIGREIALRLARDGANVAIASKSAVASGWKTIAALPDVCRPSSMSSFT